MLSGKPQCSATYFEFNTKSQKKTFTIFSSGSLNQSFRQKWSVHNCDCSTQLQVSLPCIPFQKQPTNVTWNVVWRHECWQRRQNKLFWTVIFFLGIIYSKCLCLYRRGMLKSNVFTCTTRINHRSYATWQTCPIRVNTKGRGILVTVHVRIN